MKIDYNQAILVNTQNTEVINIYTAVTNTIILQGVIRPLVNIWNIKNETNKKGRQAWVHTQNNIR